MIDAAEYQYNPQGIRIRKDVNGVVTDYLIDPANPTGYAQVLAETTIDGSAMSGTSYVLGDDVISQTESDWTWNSVTESWDLSTVDDTRCLLYDGHGSTRQLAHWTGSDISVDESYNYDGYGVMLSDGSGAAAASNAATSLLYAGEQYDPDVSGYYLRARYYNPANGLFNRVDPYAGNTHDPQSLHKYAYCHNNPVNNIDPTGMFIGGISGLTLAIAIGSVLTVTGLTVYNGVRHDLGFKAIAMQVFLNLCAFMLVIGATVLSGFLAAAATLTLIIAFVASAISIFQNRKEMDATDWTILGITFLCFLAFAGAVRTAVPPKPNIQPGQVSQLPEGYFTRITVDMRGAPAGGRTNAAGFARNAKWFWRQVAESKPDYLSPENMARINASSFRSPKVDATWIKSHPQHQSYMGETLVHHHIGQGAIATPLPESVHTGWNATLHPNQGGN